MTEHPTYPLVPCPGPRPAKRCVASNGLAEPTLVVDGQRCGMCEAARRKHARKAQAQERG